MGLKRMISVESPPSLILMFTYSFFVQGGFRLISACFDFFFTRVSCSKMAKKLTRCFNAEKKDQGTSEAPCAGRAACRGKTRVGGASS